VSLLVKAGDAVQQGQPLLELENEKAVASIPAPASGTVTRLHVKPGDKVSVGQVMVTPAVAGEAAAAAATSTMATTKAVVPQRPPSLRPCRNESASQLRRNSPSLGPDRSILRPRRRRFAN